MRQAYPGTSICRFPRSLLNDVPESITNQTSAEIQVVSSSQGPAIESYVYSLDDGASWSEEASLDTPIQLSELDDGDYSLCVNGFADGVWQDDADGTSIENATCVQWRVDTSPADAAILALAPGAPGASSAELSWTWSSDDLQEAIQQYRIWYSKVTFDAATLNTAAEVFCDIRPGPQGYEEQLIVKGLDPGQAYYFGVSSIDAAGNASALSNVATLTTAGNLPVIDSISLTLGGATADNSIAREITLTGSNFLDSERSNLIRFENSTRVFDFYSKVKTGSGAGLMFADIPDRGACRNLSGARGQQKRHFNGQFRHDHHDRIGDPGSLGKNRVASGSPGRGNHPAYHYGCQL